MQLKYTCELCSGNLLLLRTILIDVQPQLNNLLTPTCSLGPDGERRRPRRSGLLVLFDLMASKVGDLYPSRSSKSS